MANSNFIVQNGLTVGPLTIDAATGSITTSGNVNITGNLGVSQISKNDSSIGINDTGTGSNVSIIIDGTQEAYFTTTGFTVVNTIVADTLNAKTIGNSGALVTGTLQTAAQTNVTSLGTLTGLTLSGTLTGTTVNAATIGNTGALLTGTLQTAAQTNITSVGTLTGLSTSGDITVGGNLTVNGTTTTINVDTVTVEDKNITLANVASPTNTTADGGGITVKGATDKTFNWVNATAAWTSSEDLNLLSGKVYEINGTTVLSATTLGSGVTASSLTSVGTLAGLTTSAAIVPNANASVNLGSTSAWWNNVYGVAFVGVSTTAKYADLAENYASLIQYEPGTVVCFGGESEVTECDVDHCQKVAGVVSTDPAFLMNSDLEGTKVAVALQGRVPCKVIGPVAKGDMMVSAGAGRARAEANPKIGSVIGKALENFEGGEGVIEVVIGRV